jgi:hypothetical protein
MQIKDDKLLHKVPVNNLKSKMANQKLKRPPTEWEKIFISWTDKGLITRIYRELKKLNSPKINEPIKKWATELTELFQKKKFK